MNGSILLLLIAVPVLAAVVALLLSKAPMVKEGVTLLATVANLVFAINAFSAKPLSYSQPWALGTGRLTLQGAPFALDLSLRLDNLSALIVLAAAGFGVLLALYSVGFMAKKPHLGQYYFYFLITLGFTNGAALADNLIVLLFFWAGLLGTLFGMVYIGARETSATSAVKVLTIAGAADLCLIFGIGLTIGLAKTTNMSQVTSLPVTGLGGLAFLLMMIGATAKAGSMPFHSWIPNAATDAPTPFMAFVPAALEKLLGIYLLVRLTRSMFVIEAGSTISFVMMALGSVVILFAVAMALAQKDMKKLLAYHAISQVGYMILGIGTAVPAGIVGGLFHMLNHSVYKSALFMSAGAVEHATGTTDLKRLGGLGRTMPATFGAFIVAACAISGVPPFNGFYSKELVYTGALEAGQLFFFAALLGSFLTAASFLKLGHAVFIDKPRDASVKAQEAPTSLLLPLLALAGICILFGVHNVLPVGELILPATNLGHADVEHFAGLLPHIPLLALASITVTGFAVANHYFGVRQGGEGLHASDHIVHSQALEGLYERAEAGKFDPYNLAGRLLAVVSAGLHYIDRLNDRAMEGIAWLTTALGTKNLRRLHSESYAVSVAWSVAFVVVALFFLLKSL